MTSSLRHSNRGRWEECGCGAARECTHALHELPHCQPYYMHNMPHTCGELQSGTHPSLEGAETSLARPDHLASSISYLIEQLLTVE